MIVFVVLHYNVYEETLVCVESLIKLKGEKRIVIVDNGSPNNTGEKIKKRYKKNKIVDIIINKQNLGFARGNNLGYSYAKKLRPDFIVVMNNDMEINDVQFIDGVERCYNEYHFNIMAPDVYSTKTGQHQNPEKKIEYDVKKLKSIKRKIKLKLCLRGLIKIKALINKYYKAEKTKSQEKMFVNEVQLNVPLHGSFYVFDKRFIETHEECFYNKTFMYMESQILYYQAQKDKLKMVYDPRMQVLHHEDVATDDSYREHYKKAVFINKCLLDSCEAFIELLVQDES